VWEQAEVNRRGVRHYIRRQALARRRSQGETFVIANEQLDLVGLCAIARCLESRVEAEISYYIARLHRRRGYAVAAVNALCARADRQLGVSWFRADCSADNPASQRVLERAGFRLAVRRSRWSLDDDRSPTRQETRRFTRASGVLAADARERSGRVA
jgi:RimJ/RimL family protein N-acetyltransferase